MNCCDTFTGECNQGRNCPVRASTTWCETSRQPCAQPYTCATACQMITANSDGSAQHDAYTWELTPMGWFVLAGLVVNLFLTAVYFFYF